MQNKGFVTFVTASLALICAFYLSFSFVTNHYDNKAEQMGEAAGKAYLDSMANEKVYFGYTLKEVRQQQIGLGLDLKGGMNVILKLNAADLVKNLAGNPEDPNFAKALDAASKSPSQSNYIDQFVTEYKRLSPGANLAVLFGSGDLRDQINPSTSEAKVIELSDGSLLVSSRNRAGGANERTFVRSRDGGLTWTAPATWPELKGNSCNAALTRYAPVGSSKDSHLLLHTLPTSPTRDHLRIFLSEDEGKTWGYSRELCRGEAVYSEVVILEDGTLGIISEENDRPGFDIYFTRVSLNWIRKGTKHQR